MRAASDGLVQPTADAKLFAIVAPPFGWRAEPPKVSATHRRQNWLSPSGDTAFGVITFKLPLPVGPGVALWGFVRKMKQMEGEATVLNRRDDPALPGIRFTAEGGPYTVRCNLVTDDLRGWVIYAGSRRGRPVEAAELRLAERARERTQVDPP